MRDITFVYGSLNNGYDNGPADPVPNYHFERTIFSANSLKTRYNANVVFVDWCSESSKKYKNSLVSGIHYVHVPPIVNEYLHEGNESTQQFYEWIAKDIGAYFTVTDKIAFVNGDDIFPKNFIEKLTLLSFSPDTWYASNKIDITNELFKNSSLLYDIADNNPKKFNVIGGPYNFCFGDFSLMYKTSYDKAGGYPYIHKHAYGDVLLNNSLAANSVKHKTFEENFYHLAHNKAGKSYVFSQAIIDKPKIKSLILQNAKLEIL